MPWTDENHRFACLDVGIGRICDLAQQPSCCCTRCSTNGAGCTDSATCAGCIVGCPAVCASCLRRSASREALAPGKNDSGIWSDLRTGTQDLTAPPQRGAGEQASTALRSIYSRREASHDAED